jgi:hypothetical protein
MLDSIRVSFRKFLEWLLSLVGESPEVASTKAAHFREAIRQAEFPAEAIPAGSPIYEKRRDGLFSYPERAFYRVLLEVVDPRYQIFAKVRMADLLWLSNEIKDRKYHNNQILCKHLDFVLCDKGWLKPALIIELDDSSHRRYDRRESHEFKDWVFRMVDLPLLRVPVQDAYSREELKAQIEEKMSLKKEPTDTL